MSSQSRPLALLQRHSLAIELAGTATALLALWYFTDMAVSSLGGAAVGITAATIWPHVRRRYGINRGWGKLPLGVALAGLGVYALAFTGGNDVLKVGFLLVGGWLTLDGAYDLRSGAGRTDAGAPDHMDRFGDAAIVGQALQDGPKSVAELDDALALSRQRIEDAIESLQRIDAVERDGERYVSVLDERRLSDALQNESARARDRIDGLPERIARPFQLFT